MTLSIQDDDQVCPKCGHARGQNELAPPGECPLCGVVYAKAHADNAGRAVNPSGFSPEARFKVRLNCILYMVLGGVVLLVTRHEMARGVFTWVRRGGAIYQATQPGRFWFAIAFGFAAGLVAIGAGGYHMFMGKPCQWERDDRGALFKAMAVMLGLALVLWVLLYVMHT